jgi:glycosyltransferase involved in cell wall biosynthesis
MERQDGQMHAAVSVAIPTLDAGPRFVEVLSALADQSVAHSVIVCDSGSADGTVDRARAYGARVIEIPPVSFSHGATRNLLMSEAGTPHVAFLTQDAVPADRRWLERLLLGFDLAPDVGLVFGPYWPRADASISVARELTTWFDSFSSGGAPRIDVLDAGQRNVPAASFLGHRGFFTDANGCVSQTAWRQVPFRRVAYAEDHLLAQDMLRAGFAKIYVPDAAVIHSHDYGTWDRLRRSFDEARGVSDIYGQVPGGSVREAALSMRGGVRADLDCIRQRQAGTSSTRAIAELRRSIAHHAARTTGTLLGANAGRVPTAVKAKLSLERRR